MSRIRTSKTVGGVVHNYTLNGSKILKETWGDNSLIPLYDQEDSVCGLLYNGQFYYFIKNLQGDVISITDMYGNKLANYIYDAWGKCTISTCCNCDNSTCDCTIAQINPFRYRGYYYDAETELYYLQSRYYDPTVGRFINTDDASFIVSKLSFYHNPFSFCENNAIDNYDFYGFCSIKAIAMITCAIVGGLYALGKAGELINKGYFEKNHIVASGLMVYLAAFVVGGISGLYAGSKITGSFQLVLGVIGSIIAVVTFLTCHKGMLKSEITTRDVLWIALKGFAAAAIGVGNKKTAKKEIIKLIFKACRLGAISGIIDLFLF